LSPSPAVTACAEDAAGLVLSYPFRRPSPSEHRHLFAACALAPFPNTSTEADPMPSDRSNAFPALLRRAIAFIDENAHASISLDDIAAAIHVTPRAVQYMFSRHLETTPLTYLRRVRLHHAHRDLAAADPVTDTVTAIAARWGWAHPGRFSVVYKSIYGQSPSSTLRG
jgi:AraC-like DNA-binding protein